MFSKLRRVIDGYTGAEALNQTRESLRKNISKLQIFVYGKMENLV